jgi:hypothetical protein
VKLMANLDSILLDAGLVALTAVVGLLIYRRVWRTLPVFFIYSVWTLLDSSALNEVARYYPSTYFTVYFTEDCLDSALQFCVLVELSWSVLRPLRGALTEKTLVVLGALLLIAGAAIWPFAGSTTFAHYPAEWQTLDRLNQTVSILRVLFFLALAGCSQLLSIGWKDRELQVATGLGFYSMVGLTTTVLHSHQAAGRSAWTQYHTMDQFLIASYVCSLLYWVVSFAQKEAERREFTPQMQSMLLAVAGAAHTTRVTLGGTSVSDEEGKR